MHQQVSTWEDIRTVAPKTGYLYIECKNEPQFNNKDRKVTLSSQYVLVTEPGNQTIYRIDEYTTILKNYQSLACNSFFQNFLVARTFRKWKIVFL